MSDIHFSLGWKNRRRAADARRDERDDVERAEVRRIRAEIYQQQADADAAAIEAQRVALVAERCACPACAGTGRVTVEVAAGLLDAWYRYRFHEYKPSQATVAALAAIAKGEAPPPGSPVVTASYGMTLPGPGMVRAEAVPAVAETPKPAKPAKASRSVEDDSVFLADGALIEF